MNKKGFTLIELLVVIAIIGLLSTIAVVSFSNANNKAKNAKKQADIRSMQSAIELYNTDTGSYPAVPATWALLGTTLVPYFQGGLPTPPDTTVYTYCLSGTSKYLLAATLSTTTAVEGDVDGAVSNYVDPAAGGVGCVDSGSTDTVPTTCDDGGTASVFCLGATNGS
jgi:type II secretion system protein G